MEATLVAAVRNCEKRQALRASRFIVESQRMQSYHSVIIKCKLQAKLTCHLRTARRSTVLYLATPNKSGLKVTAGPNPAHSDMLLPHIASSRTSSFVGASTASIVLRAVVLLAVVCKRMGGTARLSDPDKGCTASKSKVGLMRTLRGVWLDLRQG